MAYADADVVVMSLDPDDDEVPYGVQRFQSDNSCSFKVFQALRKLQKDGRALWWKDVKVVLKQQRNSKVRICFLECNHCGELLSPANPSDSCSSHFKPNHCKGKPSASTSTSTSHSIASTKRKQGEGQPQQQHIYQAPAGLHAAATKSLARFFFRAGIPLHLIDHSDLHSAFAVYGNKLCKRTHLSTVMLDSEYDAVRITVEEKLQVASQVCSLVALATDGWRKKAAAQGTPLINAMLLLPGGGSVFCKVVDVSAQTKDHIFVAKLHEDLVAECIPGGWEQCLGVLMDNVKVNIKAMATLKMKHPK